ncbi:MAG: type II secretion system protein GspC [Woeseiaceae bacterium]
MTIEAKWSDFTSFEGERTLAAASQLLPRWVTLILVVAIAWQLARIIWMVMPGSSVGDPIVAGPSGAAVASGTRANVQVIANAHIFGEASADDAPVAAAAVVDEDLAETRQNLSLKGTIATVQPNEGLAIIADSSNEEKVYSIRDTVVPGTTLHAVYPDRVVLNEGGALKALKLPKEFPQSATPIRRSATSVSRTSSSNQSIQAVVSQNVARLADVVRPTPYMVAGQMQGYRVYPGRDRKQFAALGLRPGDLIKDIDGAALTDPQQAMQIFQSLGDADQVSVTVERNGQPQSLILKTSQLNLGNE